MPRKIAIGPYDDIVVADKINNRVQVFSNNGTFLRSFGILGVRPGELDQPEDVAVDAARGRVAGRLERLYLRDSIRNRLCSKLD